MTSWTMATKPSLDLMSPARLVRRGWKVYQYTKEVQARAAAFDTSSPRILHERATLLAEMCTNAMELHDMEMVVHGTLPDPPYIMVCNHLGYMDPIILSAIHPCAPIAKRELGDWPILGPALLSMGVMLVHRGNLHQSATILRRALRALEAGLAVVNFPEGTTTTGDHTLPFKRGIFGLARIANVPVLPSRIDFLDPKDCWTGNDGFLEHYVRFGAMPSHGVRLKISELVHPRDFEGDRDMADKVREHIDSLALA